MTFIQITNQWEEDSKSNRFLSQPQQPASHGNHFIQKIIEFINSLAVIISLWCIFDINELLILYSSLFQWIDEHKISNKAVPKLPDSKWAKNNGVGQFWLHNKKYGWWRTIFIYTTKSQEDWNSKKYDLYSIDQLFGLCIKAFEVV